MFTKVIVQQDLPLQVGESDTMHDFLLEVSQDRHKGVSAGTVRVRERFFSRVGLVQTDLRGRLLDTTMIDLMWAKQAP